MTITNELGVEIVPLHLYRYVGHNPYIDRGTVFTYVGDLDGRLGRFVSTDGSRRLSLDYNNLESAHMIVESNEQGAHLLYRERNT